MGFLNQLCGRGQAQALRLRRAFCCFIWVMIMSNTRAKKCPVQASPGRSGLALPGPGRPGPAIAGLGQPRPENWPGPAWPWPARAG